VTRKKGGTEKIKVTLDALPGTKPGDKAIIPDKLPEEASMKKALARRETASKTKEKPEEAKAEPKDKVETGLVTRKTVTGNSYWIYVPEGYDPNIAHAVVVWLHPPEKHREEDIDKFTAAWAEYCTKQHIILLGPTTENQSGFTPSDTEFVVEALRHVLDTYTVDQQRIVAHGIGVGGQMAMYLGNHARELIRGVATIGAFAGPFKDNAADQRLSFYITAGERDPIVAEIADSTTKLAEKRFPVFYRAIPNRSREYFDAPVLEEMLRWLDCLDRQ
jgi:poly(3-hydroxybutyrate) depolymerase